MTLKEVQRQILQAKQLVKGVVRSDATRYVSEPPTQVQVHVSLQEAKQASIRAAKALAKAEVTQDPLDWENANLFKLYADELVQAVLIEREVGAEEVMVPQSTRVFRKTGPPGLPPRPGLEWKESTHRWVRPHESDWGGRETKHKLPTYASSGVMAAVPVTRLQLASATQASLTRKNQLRQYASLPTLPEDPTDGLVKVFKKLDYVTAFEETLASSAMYMAVSASNLAKVLEAGEFRNSAQTGTGGSTVSAQERFGYEQQVFGMQESDFQSPELLPKYGFLAGREGMDHEQMLELPYGYTFVRFKDSARAKATMTVGDSMNANVRTTRIAPPTSMASPNAAEALWNMSTEGSDPWYKGARLNQRIQARREWVADPTWRKLRDLSGEDYLEVQFFGSLSLDDIAFVEVQSKQQATKLRKQFEGMGLDIGIGPGRYDSRLRKLVQPETFGDYFPSIGPDDVDRLGDAYVSNIVRRLVKAWHQQKRDSYFFDAPDYIDEAVVQGAEFLSKPREVQRAWLRRVVTDPLEELSEDLRPGYKPKRVGFTKDVINQGLLRAYPESLLEHYEDVELGGDEELMSLGEIDDMLREQ